MITTVGARLGGNLTPVGVVLVVVLKFVLSQSVRGVWAGAVRRGSVDGEFPAAIQQEPCPTVVGRVAPRLPNSLLEHPLGLLALSE